VLDYCHIHSTQEVTPSMLIPHCNKNDIRDSFIEQLRGILNLQDVTVIAMWSMIVPMTDEDESSCHRAIMKVRMPSNVGMLPSYTLVTWCSSGDGAFDHGVTLNQVTNHHLFLLHLVLHQVLKIVFDLLWTDKHPCAEYLICHDSIYDVITGNMKVLHRLRETISLCDDEDDEEEEENTQPIIGRLIFLLNNCDYTAESVHETIATMIEIGEGVAEKAYGDYYDMLATDYKIECHKVLLCGP
jgi:hypothetical protein